MIATLQKLYRTLVTAIDNNVIISGGDVPRSTTIELSHKICQPIYCNGVIITKHSLCTQDIYLKYWIILMIAPLEKRYRTLVTAIDNNVIIIGGDVPRATRQPLEGL